jgi:sterol desaturase/sphingolipid hydroxylase (fatty acid hydroxylase superfamily)
MTSFMKRLTPWALRLGALGVTATAVVFDTGLAFAIPVLFVLVVPFEKMFPRHPGQRVRRPLALLDIRWALVSVFTNVVTLAVGIVVAVVSLAWLPGLALRPLVAMLPGWATPLAGIALFDLAIYWAHRWSHEVPALWRFHAVHHSTEHLDWISGFRVHPLDGVIIAPAAAFLFGAGFDNTFTGALAVVQIVTGLFLHANVRWRWRPLQRLVSTPEFHHWHHAYEREAHNSNYSGFLPVWDIVFGTYYMPRNKRPVRYGVAEPIPPTMRGQIAHPFRGLRPRRHAMRPALRRLGRDIWRSTTRPRTRYARPGEPYQWTRVPPATRPPAPAV